MTDKKISELTSITGADVSDADDILPIVDTSVATTKKITRAELFKSVSSVDINGGTIDGVTIGGASAGAATFTSATVNGNITVTGTVDGRDVATDGTKLDGIEAGADVTDTTNVTAAGALMDSELTNITAVKALDQGVATTDSPSFAGITATTADINGGTIDGVTLGTNSAVTEAQVDNLNINGNAITSTDTNGNIALTPNGTGEVDISKVDIDGGTIDGTVIGGSTPAAISGTTGTFSGNLTVDTTTLFVDAAANEVGIGTSSPNARLSIKQSGNSTLGGLELIRSDTTAYSVMYMGGDDALYFQNQANGAMAFYTSNTLRMTIASTGNVTITGSLSKGSGSFKIDHPIKPDTHHLVHSFIEGPQADNIYRGKVALADGKATVNLDEAARMTEGTFVALNGNVQCFTTNEHGWTAVRGKVEGNILTIEAQDAACADTVSWVVIGERHDQHMIDANWTDENGRVITEPEKEIAS